MKQKSDFGRCTRTEEALHGQTGGKAWQLTNVEPCQHKRAAFVAPIGFKRPQTSVSAARRACGHALTVAAAIDPPAAATGNADLRTAGRGKPAGFALWHAQPRYAAADPPASTAGNADPCRTAGRDEPAGFALWHAQPCYAAVDPPAAAAGNADPCRTALQPPVATTTGDTSPHEAD